MVHPELLSAVALAVHGVPPRASVASRFGAFDAFGTSGDITRPRRPINRPALDSLLAIVLETASEA
jgi:hypothetical protein